MSHTLQYLLVEADSHEEARDIVAGKLEDSPEWSDWHNATYANDSFAGDWEFNAFTYFSTGKGDKEPTGVQSDTLSYAENPELAEKAISVAVQVRLEEIARFRDNILTNDYDIVVAQHDPYENQSFSLNNYYYEKLAKLLDNDWNSNSAIFDLEEWTASLYKFAERAKTKPERQFIVAVDFHH